MRTLFSLASFAIAALATLPVAQEHASPKLRRVPNYLEGRERRAVEIYERVVPTVVTIFTSQEAALGASGEASRSGGSRSAAGVSTGF